MSCLLLRDRVPHPSPRPHRCRGASQLGVQKLWQSVAGRQHSVQANTCDQPTRAGPPLEDGPAMRGQRTVTLWLYEAFVPSWNVTVRVTVYVPVRLYVWAGFCWLDVDLSPNFQA